MLYQTFKVNINSKRNIWDTQKNIEVDVKWAQKKEELVKRTKKNKF